MPNDITHHHFVAVDEYHSPMEHCENVVYHAAVSSEHQCSHSYHLHSSPSHCFACDNHFTSHHREHGLIAAFVSMKTTRIHTYYILRLQDTIPFGIYNKGPPLFS